MLNTVLEEDQVHFRVLQVVIHEQICESGHHFFGLAKLLVATITTLEVTEGDIFKGGEFPVEVEVLLEDLVGHFRELLAILLVDQTITEDAISLAHVELYEVVLVDDVFKLAHQHTLHHLAQVTQVERVMALGRRGEEFIDDFRVDLDGRLDDHVCTRGQT